jgi:Ca2+-dependent lipid-binding protein
MSKTIGPYAEKDLKEKLVQISDSEIQNYNRSRIIKNRILYILALFFAIIGVVCVFFNYIWISMILGFIGIGMIQVGRYNRERWNRTYENLMYLRNERQRELSEQKPKSKFSR